MDLQKPVTSGDVASVATQPGLTPQRSRLKNTVKASAAGIVGAAVAFTTRLQPQEVFAFLKDVIKTLGAGGIVSVLIVGFMLSMTAGLLLFVFRQKECAEKRLLEDRNRYRDMFLRNSEAWQAAAADRMREFAAEIETLKIEFSSQMHQKSRKPVKMKLREAIGDLESPGDASRLRDQPRLSVEENGSASDFVGLHESNKVQS